VSNDDLAHPSSDSWVVAVHASEYDYTPLGTAVVIARDRVLTCAHVVLAGDATRDELWVAFPKVTSCKRLPVLTVKISHAPPVKDLAVLTLSAPVPPSVETARLRCPHPADLVGMAWWAYGFPNGDPIGNSANGHVGESLSYGWVRLDTSSRYLVEQGFSGGPLWSKTYEAVVGVVGQAHHNGDGRAITLHHASMEFPDLKIALLTNWSAEAAGKAALQEWGWALADDSDGVRHWRPRARGVSIESEPGWRFRGRTAALSRIVSWLDRPTPGRRVLVVTGSPGVGKSAVLGRIVTTADPTIRASLPADDVAVRARVGSVSCAVHVKGKTALEVAGEIARAASASLPLEPGDLAPALKEALVGRTDSIAEEAESYDMPLTAPDLLEERQLSPFNVIIDALDEAASPVQARVIVSHIILPLAETCADAGVQVIVGSRRRDDGGDLLSRFGGALDVIDLDEPNYFAEGDLNAYALACLQLAGDERPGNPYTDDTIAMPLAARIAALSEQNFLVAGIVARTHGLHDDLPAQPDSLTFTATVDAALAAYLEQLQPVSGVPAVHVLTALAFAEAPGLPLDLWQLALEAIYRTSVRGDDLARFARSSAANFLIEAGDGDKSDSPSGEARPVYRLFHQALNDTLLHGRDDISTRADDERALMQEFLKRGRLCNWQEAPRYLLRSLADHARAGGLVDDLLSDDAYLLYADLRRLIQVANAASSTAARRRVRLLRLTPQAIPAAPAERAALFSVTEALDDLGTIYRAQLWQAPYKAQWAAVGATRERISLEGHEGTVNEVCAVTINGLQVLASASSDRTVQLWDPATGQQYATLEGHVGRVNGICAITVNGRSMLASAGVDTVRVWDPATGQQHVVLRGQGTARRVRAITVNGHDLLASASGAAVRLWDPATGQQHLAVYGHQGFINGVCAITVNGEHLLASASNDQTVRLWDPATGQLHATLHGHYGSVNGVCAITVDDKHMLASGGSDETVRLWDPATGQLHATLHGHHGPVNGVCAITVDDKHLLASGGLDDSVRLWDPATSAQIAILLGHRGLINGVCAITVNGEHLLASASNDQTVRLWDPAANEQGTIPSGHHGPVNGVCAITVNGQHLLASASNDQTVRLWDPATGQMRATLHGHHGPVNGVCAITVNGEHLLASGGLDGSVRLWDPATGQLHATLHGHHGPVNGVCAITVDDKHLLASGGSDETVRLWDPTTGQLHATLHGHHGPVNGVCAITVNGQHLLASASNDQTVRLWDPVTGQQHLAVHGHQGFVIGVCAITVNGQHLLASASNDQMVRLWDPATGQLRATLRGHHGPVNDVCAITVNGQHLLASASNDRTVRLWDPQTGAIAFTIPTHHVALAVASITNSLGIGLLTGVLMITVRTDP